MTFAHLTASATTIGSETYKDNLYLVVDLGRDSNAYNDLQMNQSARVARVLGDNLLKTLKAFSVPVADVQKIYGFKDQVRNSS